MPGTPTIVTTAVGQAQVPANTSQVRIVADKMPTLNENVARLASLVMKVSKKAVANTTFGHNEQEALPFLFTWNGATESTASTSLLKASFTNGAAVVAEDILFNPRQDSKERMCMTVDSTTFTVKRNIEGGTGLLKNGDTLIRIGNARGEGVTTARASKTTSESFKTFYLQNLNWTKKLTEIAVGVKTYNDPRRVNEHKKMGIEAKLDLEFMLMFGYSSADIGTALTSWAAPTSMGLDQHCEAGGNVTSVAMLTYDEIESALEAPYGYGAVEGFTMFCSPFVAKVINGFARQQTQIRQDETTYGQRFKVLNTTYGDVNIVPLPLLTGNYLKGLAWFVPNPLSDYIIHRFFAGNGQNHDFRVLMGTQAAQSQNVEDEMRTWCGYEFYENYKFAKIHGVVG